MHTVFSDGEFIDEINGTIDGGLTVLVDSADELAALQAFCLECAGLVEFGHRVRRYDEWLTDFERNRREYEIRVEKTLEGLSDKSPNDCSDMERLLLSQAFIREIWQETAKEDSQGLCIVTCVSDTGIEMRYAAQIPALFFHDGSLLSTITHYAPRLGKFVLVVGSHGVAIVRKAGVMPSIHADRLVEDTRSAARNKAVFKDLPRLDKIRPADVANKKGILLLLHGLFSTDMGTFDGFIKAWGRSPTLSFIETEHLKTTWARLFPERATAGLPLLPDFTKAFQEALQADYLIVGWPHDTMTKIKTNAEMLFEEIESSLGADSPPMVFVCHSRGGLVARKAAVIMQEQGGPWGDKVRLCVTFGTPHRGAALAESTFQYVAAVASYMNGTGQIMSACRVLDYYGSTKRFEGIDDLRPVNAPGSDFLGELMEDERKAAKPAARRLDIMPVGSIYSGKKRRWARFMSGILGTEEHDLVVAKKSSLPGKSFPEGELSRCGHSEYFDDFQIDEPHFSNVLEKIRRCLEVENAALKRVIPTPTPSPPRPEDFARLLRSKRGTAPKLK